MGFFNRTKKTRLSEKKGFKSGFEERINLQLSKENCIFEYESERLTYVVEHKYTPDFIVTKKDGSKMYIEAKGRWTGGDRSKIKEVIRQNPGIDLRIVFTNPHAKIGKKDTYAKWCDRGVIINGNRKNRYKIKWASTRVPKEWLKE